jgi:hypothetical protein
MPLTVCLGVLGRHIESLEFLEIMIGDEPPLTLAQSFYHRALSGSENEAIDQIEEALKNGQDLITCYQDVVLEALVLAEVDRHRGVLDDDHADKMNKVVQSVLAELADQEDRLTGKEADSANQGGGVPIAALAPAADHGPVLVIAGPGQFDHTIALVFSQLLERSGMQAKLQPQLSVSPLSTGVSIVYLSCLHLGHSPTFLRYSVAASPALSEPSLELRQLETLSHDLAAVRESVEQLAAGQEQIARDIAKLSYRRTDRTCGAGCRRFRRPPKPPRASPSRRHNPLRSHQRRRCRLHRLNQPLSYQRRPFRPRRQNRRCDRQCPCAEHHILAYCSH